MSELSAQQRKFLKGLAHNLEPVVRVGRGGLSDGLMATVDEALNQHELIKVKFQELKDQKKEACAELARRLGSQTVGIIGHVATLYRQARDPEERKIRLPANKAASGLAEAGS